RTGPIGKPVLPVMPAKLILPRGHEIEEVTVLPGRKVTLAGSHAIRPGQKPVPLIPEAKQDVTPPDPAVYGSDDPYPGKLHDVVTVQKRRGMSFVVINMHPVEYRPLSGTVSCYESLRLNVKTRPTGEPDGIRFRSDTVRPLTDGADNPSMLDGYTDPGPLGATLGLCDPADSYQYVVVTSAAIRDATTDCTIRDLVAHKQGRGISATIVLIEDVLATYPGVDDPEKLRNFITDAYNSWETDFVLLGGDINIIPLRGLWCLADGDPPYEDHVPSDLYYQCLDGEYNSDGDDRWGEPTDGANGTDVDLFAEVYIGRASAENATEMSNFVFKTLSYENDPPGEDYLSRALLAGEYMGFLGIAEYAKPYMEEIRLGADTHGYTTAGFAACDLFTVETIYDADWKVQEGRQWEKWEMIDRINSNRFGIINAIGDLTNTKFFFGNSQACVAGAFERDCIAEWLTTNTRQGAFAVILNSRVGWGMWYSTDGPGQAFQRQFYDAYFAEFISSLGALNADSHEDNIWKLNHNCVRWTYYETNLLGDPQTRLGGRLEEPLVGFLEVAEDDTAGGNGDGLINPDEEIDLTVTLKNHWPEGATGVTATLSEQDPYVTVTDGSASFGDIAGRGASKQAQDPFRIRISSGCPTPREVTLELDISDSGTGSWTDTFSVMVYTSSRIDGT
ncbi:MAG: C25 family cysteine peptidase, partial [Planctomycetota bacterium]